MYHSPVFQNVGLFGTKLGTAHTRGEPVVNTTQICPMSYLRKRRQKEHAAHAHKGRLQQELAPTAIESQVDVVMSPQIDLTLDDKTDSDGQCDWNGI